MYWIESMHLIFTFSNFKGSESLHLEVGGVLVEILDLLSHQRPKLNPTHYHTSFVSFLIPFKIIIHYFLRSGIGTTVLGLLKQFAFLLGPWTSAQVVYFLFHVIENIVVIFIIVLFIGLLCLKYNELSRSLNRAL